MMVLWRRIIWYSTKKLPFFSTFSLPKDIQKMHLVHFYLPSLSCCDRMDKPFYYEIKEMAHHRDKIYNRVEIYPWWCSEKSRSLLSNGIKAQIPNQTSFLQTWKSTLTGLWGSQITIWGKARPLCYYYQISNFIFSKLLVKFTTCEAVIKQNAYQCVCIYNT